MAGRKKIEEAQRLEELWKPERQARAQGFHVLAGLDEAGRGPWAGPVAAAAVVLPENFYLEGVNDSKKLSAKKREQLAGEIRRQAQDWAVVLVSPQVIDRINILQATRQAMTQAVRALQVQPDYLLLDAIHLPELSLPQEELIRGDQRSMSIACASILAKVTRDEAMKGYEQLYPVYGFLQHKGYGTKQHQAALQKFGVSPIHRLSYRPVQAILQSDAGRKA